MSLLPAEAISTGKPFCGQKGANLSATDTDFYAYTQSFQENLVDAGLFFSDDEFRSIQSASALFDALARTQLNESHEIEPQHHVFVVFHQAPGSKTWRLQFANSAYLEKIGANLDEKTGITAEELATEFYTPGTIAEYTAASGAKGWYNAKFIPMDNVPENTDGDKPAYFWYRKEFNHPEGGKIQVRIGMSGTGLDNEQKKVLTDILTLTEVLRKKDINVVRYASPSYNPLIARIKDQTFLILGEERGWDKSLVLQLGWMQMILEVAEDIIHNSPFPLTILDREEKIQQISPAYAVLVGRTVQEILDPDFWKKAYPGDAGRVLKESMRHYEEVGFYPEGTMFMLERGDSFASLEEKLGLVIPRTIGVLPQPVGFPDMTVRLNTTLPLESIGHLLD